MDILGVVTVGVMLIMIVVGFVDLIAKGMEPTEEERDRERKGLRFYGWLLLSGQPKLMPRRKT
jgi:hypothetical protein